MKPGVEAFRRFYRQELIPKRYSGIFHGLFTASSLVVSASFLYSQVASPSIGELLLVPVIVLLGGLVVWWIHKFPLHVPSKLFSYKIHTRYHHRFFTYDNITLRDSRDLHIVFFPMWAVVIYSTLVLPLFYWVFSSIISANAGFLTAGTAAIYFLSYEAIHLISHLPDDHPVLKIPYFRNQRTHHRIHHDPLQINRNFGIVYPLWDHLLGTAVSEPHSQIGRVELDTKR